MHDILMLNGFIFCGLLWFLQCSVDSEGTKFKPKIMSTLFSMKAAFIHAESIAEVIIDFLNGMYTIGR